jgi:hypothetical protein
MSALGHPLLSGLRLFIRKRMEENGYNVEGIGNKTKQGGKP